MDEKIVVILRVQSCAIKSSTDAGKNFESVEVKATGEWLPERREGEPPSFPITYPASLHITAYPGCGAIPVIGDRIIVTVERPIWQIPLDEAKERVAAE